MIELELLCISPDSSRMEAVKNDLLEKSLLQQILVTDEKEKEKLKANTMG